MSAGAVVRKRNLNSLPLRGRMEHALHYLLQVPPELADAVNLQALLDQLGDFLLPVGVWERGTLER